MPNKATAIRNLRDAGHTDEADELDLWRNMNGENGGWDGFARRRWPHLVAVNWPDGHGNNPRAAQPGQRVRRRPRRTVISTADVQRLIAPETVRQVIGQETIDRTITVAGCDVGISENDANTGFVVVRHTVGQPLEVLHLSQNYMHEDALRDVPTLCEKYDVDYLVLDAPLLPAPRATPPDRNVDETGTIRCYRPNEDVIRPPSRAVLEAGLAQHLSDETISLEHMARLLNRMPPLPTWLRDGTRNTFGQKGQEILAAVEAQTSLRFPTNSCTWVQQGILEGFPKAFYLPLLPPVSDLEDFGDIEIHERGTVDEGLIMWLLDRDQPGRFWEVVGLLPPSPEDRKSNRFFRQSLMDPDKTSALAMALNGVLYGRGKAAVIHARIPPTDTEPGFDFGHILTLTLSLFQPWARYWLAERLSKSRRTFVNAELGFTQWDLKP